VPSEEALKETKRYKPEFFRFACGSFCEQATQNFFINCKQHQDWQANV